MAIRHRCSRGREENRGCKVLLLISIVIRADTQVDTRVGIQAGIRMARVIPAAILVRIRALGGRIALALVLPRRRSRSARA